MENTQNYHSFYGKMCISCFSNCLINVISFLNYHNLTNSECSLFTIKALLIVYKLKNILALSVYCSLSIMYKQSN